jgi:7,8-dihydropterin-6-yl-methyl-4-(beta-D-ribofuranosyl)aminobenzene 5'-phosphate synthase
MSRYAFVNARLASQPKANDKTCVLINENGKNSLFCGCSHRGIINIVEKAKDITNNNLNTVVGGFHLMGIDVKDSNDKAFLDELSDALSKKNINKYYTCHCTGEQPYKYLCQKVNNLGELKTGTVIEI